MSARGAHGRGHGSQAPGRRGVAQRSLSVLASCLLTLALAGCGVYSFSGASLPAAVRTLAVPLAEREAPGGPPTLDATLTDALVERFVDRAGRRLEPDEGAADAVVRATLTRYTVAPAAVTGDNVAALNRLTLAVRVVMAEREAEAPRLDRTFTASADFEPAEGLAGEATAAETAATQIARDAFTAATSEW